MAELPVGVAPLVMLIWVMAGLLIGCLGMVGARSSLGDGWHRDAEPVWVGNGPVDWGAAAPAAQRLG